MAFAAWGPNLISLLDLLVRSKQQQHGMLGGIEEGFGEFVVVLCLMGMSLTLTSDEGQSHAATWSWLLHLLHYDSLPSYKGCKHLSTTQWNPTS